MMHTTNAIVDLPWQRMRCTGTNAHTRHTSHRCQHREFRCCLLTSIRFFLYFARDETQSRLDEEQKKKKKITRKMCGVLSAKREKRNIWLLFPCRSRACPSLFVFCCSNVFQRLMRNATSANTYTHSAQCTSNAAKIRQTRAHAVPFILAEIPISTRLNESVLCECVRECSATR